MPKPIAATYYLKVERDIDNPNRVNVLFPPDLINQLRIFALLIKYRLLKLFKSKY